MATIEIDYCRYCSGAFDTRQSDGMLRVHGPRNHRCKGSGQMGSNAHDIAFKDAVREPLNTITPKKARDVKPGDVVATAFGGTLEVYDTCDLWEGGVKTLFFRNVRGTCCVTTTPDSDFDVVGHFDVDKAARDEAERRADA